MKKLLLISLIFILLSTPIIGNIRPTTGTFLKDSERNGYGVLTIKNDMNKTDAICIISSVDEPKKVLIAVYIRAKETFTIKGIKDGKYYLYFSLGEKWDSNVGKFTKNARYERFKDIFIFKTQRVESSIHYTVYKVTLYEVVGGTAKTINIPKEDFPKIK
ncbi:MAG: hypothetical protein NZ841_07735 [Dictyoglomus sp.]|nr:hypothetical protein [Dictyoglomus sp.]MDW8189170.1 hypothetical protein [Dictyoglomus sp.]